jgi:hypothetical protein
VFVTILVDLKANPKKDLDIFKHRTIFYFDLKLNFFLDIFDFQNFDRKSEISEISEISKIFQKYFRKIFFCDSVGHIKTWIPELVGCF